MIGGKKHNSVKDHTRNHCQPGARTLNFVITLQLLVLGPLFSLCRYVCGPRCGSLYSSLLKCIMYCLACHQATSHLKSFLGLDPGLTVLTGQYQGLLVLEAAKGGSWCHDRWTPQVPTPGEPASLFS